MPDAMNAGLAVLADNSVEGELAGIPARSRRMAG
jgi:hypothetical protein